MFIWSGYLFLQILELYIVDDDEDDRFLIGNAIEELEIDVNVVYACNGIELLQMLNKEIDNALILIDMNMPIMNGVETLKAVYADPSLKHLRSILISTSDNRVLKQLALESGAMQFICKPTHYDDYLRLIEDVYNKCF